MKVAKLQTFAVDVICPNCEELVEEPKTSSFMWEIGQLKRGQVNECNNCGEKFKLPVRVSAAAI